jgi:acyl-CoA reductase-like NAD-dependent aldehyde dehydrogenase
MAYKTINPYNGKRIKQFAEHTDAEVEKAVAQAQDCFAM